MLHITDVAADAMSIYRAITTTDGIQSFWTADAEVGPSVGSRARFGFPEAPVDLRMQIETLEPGTEVRWRCLGDFPYWDGTAIEWRLSPSPDATGTRITFRHADWPEDYPDVEFGLVNWVWGQVVGRLKLYVETGRPDPVYPDARTEVA
jgi:uncharacterized protein YndB with AHSA1/START domain